MSRHLRNALRAAVLMLLVYVAVDLLTIRLGWGRSLHWAGAIGAAVAFGWLTYRRSVRHHGTGVAAP